MKAQLFSCALLVALICPTFAAPPAQQIQPKAKWPVSNEVDRQFFCAVGVGEEDVPPASFGKRLAQVLKDAEKKGESTHAAVKRLRAEAGCL